MRWLQQGVDLFPKYAHSLPRIGLPNKFKSEDEEDWALAQLVRQERKWGTVEECGEDDVDHISGVRCISHGFGTTRPRRSGGGRCAHSFDQLMCEIGREET